MRPVNRYYSGLLTMTDTEMGCSESFPFHDRMPGIMAQQCSYKLNGHEKLLGMDVLSMTHI